MSQVTKGKTTAAELRQMFGEPFSKTVISETEEKWLYSHSSGTVRVVAMKAQTTGRQKTLDLLLKDGVVTNFAYTDGPAPVYTTH